MALAERVKKSEVFSGLSKKDRVAVLQAIEAGNKEVIQETEAILTQEDSVNKAFKVSIDELTNQVIEAMEKRFSRQRQKDENAEMEATNRVQELERAEHELEIIADLSLSNKTNN